MRDVQSTESRPILVHCSAGCGRTGTICSIDYVWALLRSGKLRDDFSLFEIISDMRKQRTSMVQTVEQYILCYKAVSTLFEQHLKLIDSHTYENIDGDGKPLGIKVIKQEEDESSVSEQNNSKENIPLSSLIIPSVKDNFLLESSASMENNIVNAQLQRSQSMLEPNEEVRHNEKIVGKATVIRRPSIAKLKAIFDNSSVSSLSNNELSRAKEISPSRTKLQRSQSIKENIRNLNFNIQLEINQSNAQHRKSKSYTLSAAKFSVYKKHFSIGNLTFQQDKEANENKILDENNSNNTINETTTIKIDNNSDLATHNKKNPFLENVNSQNSDYGSFVRQNNQKNSNSLLSNCLPETVHKSATYSYSQSQSVNSNSIYSCLPSRPQNVRERARSSLDDSLPNAPPKPPRTYQHIVDDSCIVRTSEGRLIVTVAQPKLNTESSFIPIHLNNTRYEYGGNNSFYEPLGTRKFHLSSPNLVLADQVTYFSPNEPSNKIKVQQTTVKHQYCENNNSNNNPVYNSSLTSKPFPRSMISMNSNQNSHTPIPESFTYINNSTQYPIDLFGNQHFQYHQAKPIILQQNFFEPIYGTSRPPFLPPRSSNPIISSNPSSNLGGSTRPGSISQGNYKLPNQTYESIYSNREMCFKMSTKQFSNIVSDSANSKFVPITEPKENIYAQIGNMKTSNNTDSSKIISDTKAALVVRNGQTNSETTTKLGSLSKFKNVFKIFRMKNSVNSKICNSSSNNLTTSNNNKNSNVQKSFINTPSDAKMSKGGCNSINLHNGKQKLKMKCL